MSADPRDDLIGAVCEDNRAKVNTLINELGISHSETLSTGYTLLRDAIIVAVEEGRLKIIEDLLNHGADVEALIPNGICHTLLHEAANNDHFEIVKLLINHGADVNAKDANGQLPIFFAIANKNVTMTRLLMSSGTEINNCHDLLHLAVNVRSMEIFYMILSVSDLDVNARDHLFGRTALHWTVIPQEYSCDIGNRWKKRPTAGSLSQPIVFVEDRNSCVAMECEMAEAILLRGANVNARCNNGQTTLHNAVYYGHIGVVEILLKHKADVNCRTKFKRTPLIHSVKRDHEGTIRMLRYHDAINNNVKETYGVTALHIACRNNGNEKIVSMLLDFGADINSKGILELSSLHIAVICEYTRIVEILLIHDANVNCVNKFKETPLHCSAKRGNETITRLLLNNDAEINATERYGKTALCIAFEKRHGDVITTLLEFGADFDSNDKLAKQFLRFDHHIIKMKALNVTVSQSNIALIDIAKEHFFYKECRREIEMCKDERISDTNVTFYDMLTKGIDQLAIYARNLSILETLESGKYKKKFPIYGNIIYNNFKKGDNRNCLLYRSAKSLNFLSGFALPELSSAIVLNKLSTKELKNLIKAGNHRQCLSGEMIG